MLRKVAYIGLELKEHSIPEKVERKTQETDKFLLLSLPWVSRTRRSSVAISLFLVYIYIYIYNCAKYLKNLLLQSVSSKGNLQVVYHLKIPFG